MKELIKNIEARVLPLTVIAMFIVAGFTTVFVLYPGNDVVVHAASVDQFSYYKTLTIDHDFIDADLTDFTVMVNISSDTDLASDVLDSGWDIAFFDNSDTQLAHEIEYFDGDTGKLVAWVNVTSLSSSVDTIIKMYYGDSDIGSSAEDVSGTWDSSFEVVIHCNQSSSPLEDSVCNNQYTGSGTPTYESTGGMGAGYYVCYGDDEDNMDTSPDSWTNTDDRFVSLLLKRTGEDDESTAIDMCAFSTKDSAGRSRIDLIHDVDTPDTFRIFFRDANGDEDGLSSPELTLDEWYHIAVCINCSTGFLGLYKNGVLVNSTVNTDINSYSNEPVGVYLGDWQEYNRNWIGCIDEVRVSSAVRNSSWIKAEYNNYNPNFLTVGSEQTDVEGDYSISGLNVDTRFTHQGSAGDTNISNLVMRIYTNTSGTSDNCTSIFLDFSGGFPSGYSASNFSFQVRNTSDGTFSNDWNTVTGNMTLNSTTWAGAWAYGTNPFPINGYNSTIEVRMRVAIPSNASAGTNTTDAWILKWAVI